MNNSRTLSSWRDDAEAQTALVLQADLFFYFFVTIVNIISPLSLPNSCKETHASRVFALHITVCHCEIIINILRQMSVSRRSNGNQLSRVRLNRSDLSIIRQESAQRFLMANLYIFSFPFSFLFFFILLFFSLSFAYINIFSHRCVCVRNVFEKTAKLNRQHQHRRSRNGRRKNK